MMSQSWTPEPVEPRGDMQHMASLQKNKHMKGCKSLKQNEAPADQPANKQTASCMTGPAPEWNIETGASKLGTLGSDDVALLAAGGSGKSDTFIQTWKCIEM